MCACIQGEKKDFNHFYNGNSKKMKNAPETIRVNEDEKRLIGKKLLEINKLLANQQKQTYTFSQLVHLIIKEGTNKIKIDKNGNLTI